jgi:hypothetical protein
MQWDEFVNGDWVRIRREVFLAYMNARSQHSSEVTEENHKNLKHWQ